MSGPIPEQELVLAGTSILEIADKYTSMTLLQYAFASSTSHVNVMRIIRRQFGSATLIKAVLDKNANGKNCLHFSAMSSEMISYFLVKFFKKRLKDT